MKTNKLPAGNRSGRLALLILAVLMLLGLQTVHASEPVDPNKQTDYRNTEDPGLTGPAYVPAQLVVGLETGAAASEVLGDGRVVGVVATMAHASTMLLELAPGVDVHAAAADVAAGETIRYAHPNYLIDHLHPVQGSYPFPDIEGGGEYSAQSASVTLSLAAAHQSATGSGVTVGILDVGIDFDHPTLTGQVASGHDYIDDDEYSLDEPGGLHSGHGTFVAGVVHLAAPDAQVKAYRIVNADGYGDGFTLARAIERAVDEDCQVINLSVALTDRHLAVRDAIEYASSADALIVAAAGNRGSSQQVYPAAETAAMAVGAVDSTQRLATFGTYGNQISVCAPGVDIYSTFLDDDFAWWSGTSFSTPFVAGVAALLAEASPAAAAAMIRGAMEITAADLDFINPGYEGLLGHGLIDPPAALAYMGAPTGATVTPDTLFFEHQVGRLYFVAPFQFVWLQSTNAPAVYFAEVTGPDPIFSWVADSVGVTNDSVTISIQPPDIPGTFVNRVLFHVDSVAAPAELVVHLTVTQDTVFASASATPDMLFFQAQLGAEVMYSAEVLLQSSNAPANYVAGVFTSGPPLVSLPDSTGTTNDSVTILVDPSLAPATGVYQDTVAFFVENVAYPVPVFVIVEIIDTIPPDTTGLDSAWAIPDTGLTIVTDDLDTLWDCVFIHSSNAPAPYFVEILGTPTFVWLADSVGMTNDSVCFLASAFLPPGTYADTLLFWVDGVVNNPVVVPIRLIVPLAQTLPEIRIDTVSALDGSEVEVVVRAPVGGLPWGGFDFQIAFDDSLLTFQSGVAGDFLINCGWEYFTAVALPPDTGLVRIIALADRSNVPGQPTCLEPTPGDVLARLTFGVVADSNLLCTTTPIRFWWNDCGDNGIATETGDPLIIAGDTPGSVRDYNGLDLTLLPNVGGPPWPCPPGANEPLVGARFRNGAVYINCGGVPGDSAWVMPDTLHFTYTEGFNPTVLPSAWLWLASSNAPATWTAMAYAPGPLPLYTVLLDSAGTTNDSVEIHINPAGMAPGSYPNSVIYTVDGVAQTAIVSILLTIVPDSSLGDSLPPVSGLANYPNPFNPQTEIAFSLAAAAQVRLEVFNILGQSVATLIDQQLAAGQHRVPWRGTDGRGRPAASGVYFYRLHVAGEVYLGKMVMVR